MWETAQTIERTHVGHVATSTEDRVAVTATYLRAAAEGNLRAMRKSGARYAHLLDTLPPSGAGLLGSTGFRALQDHLVELHRSLVAEDIRELSQTRHLEPDLGQQRKAALLFKLAAFVPGGDCSPPVHHRP